MAEKTEETEEERISKLVSERVAAALADAQTPDDEKRVQSIVDKAVAKALGDHLPGALDAFFDKLTSDEEGSSDNAPSTGVLDFLFGGRKS